MKTRPVSEIEPPEYPDRRRFLQAIGMTATGAALMALGLPAALADPPPPPPGKPPVEPGKENAKQTAFCAETFSKTVDQLAVKLGSDDFKIRKQATAALIVLGKGDGKNKDIDAKRRKIVVQKMEVLRRAKDPEVAQRAKTVLLALTPKKTPRPPEQPVQLEGDTVIEID